MKAPLKFQTGLSRQAPVLSILPATTVAPYIKRNQKFVRKICIVPHFVIASRPKADVAISDIMQTSQIIKQ